MKKKLNSGLIIGAGTMIGMGIGFLTGDMKSFMFIGIGIGFLIAYLLPLIIKNGDHEVE